MNQVRRMAQVAKSNREPKEVNGRAKVLPRTKFYLFLLLITLPIDAFVPTGMLLREAGGKPSIPLMVLGAAWIFWRHWSELLFSCPKLWRTILLLCIAIAFVGVVAFVVNLGLDISYSGGLRSPLGQFASQSAIFVLVAPALIAHAWLFSKKEVQQAFLYLLPIATLIHLLAIFAEWFGLMQATAFPLTFFRGPMVIDGRKPTGFMTEPSYVGAFAAMYGLGLLLCMPTKRKRDQLLAALSIVTALAIGGKTLIPALLLGLIGYAYQVRAKLFSRRVLASLLALAVVAAYFIMTYSVLDLRMNLSSAMRFGSTMLALNAAAAGYGLLGIGFGQFHFIYTPQFAPSFLEYSPEAQAIFTRIADMRASTYNLPARFLIEEGVLGFMLFLHLIRMCFRNGRAHNDRWHQWGAVLAGSSLGFLLTQDTYFYPAFVCGAAVLVSQSAQA